MLQAASAKHRAGDLDGAEALYRRVLDAVPAEPNALHLLGVIAYQRGDHARAVDLISRAATALPNVADVFANLGNALQATGRPEPAVATFRRAIELRATSAQAHAGLARALNDLGAHAAALEAAQRAAVLDSAMLDAPVQMAVALTALERLAEAGAAYQVALRLDPDQPAVLARFAHVLTLLDQPEAALVCHRRALALRPDDSALHLALARSLMHQHDLTAAIESFRRATDLAPAIVEAWQGLGACLSMTGAFAAAGKAFQQALALDPDNAEALRSLAAIDQPANDPDELARLQRILADANLPAERRIAAGFAAGERLDRLDRYDEAFACFDAANALVRDRHRAEGTEFDIADLRRYVDEAIAHCTPAFFRQAPDWGNSSESPVLIVGMPRSGSTLVEQVAASHPSVAAAGELPDLDLAVRGLMLANSGRALADWDAATARSHADAYVARLASLGAGAVRVLDKMPDNVLLLGIAAALLPRARVVLCRRDLRDVCFSCFCQRFAEGHAYASDLATCGERALEVERLVAHWRTVLPLPMLELRYEDVVTDFEGQARRLIDFLGLPWDPVCLDFHALQRPVITASSWQVRQPLYASAVGRWHRYADHLGSLFAVLGMRRGDNTDATAATRRGSLHPRAADALGTSACTPLPD